MPESPRSTCTILKASQSGESYDGRQGLTYASGISAETAGAQALCLTRLELPPGARAKAHLHERHETAIYVISGEAEMIYGEGLGEHAVLRAGDYVYIPAGVPHLPYNASRTESCVAILARTDPNEQESVVLLPELDGVLREA